MPTCPQQPQQKQKKFKPRFQVDHAARQMPEKLPPERLVTGRDQIGKVGDIVSESPSDFISVHPGDFVGIRSYLRTVPPKTHKSVDGCNGWRPSG